MTFNHVRNAQNLKSLLDPKGGSNLRDSLRMNCKLRFLVM